MYICDCEYDLLIIIFSVHHLQYVWWCRLEKLVKKDQFQFTHACTRIYKL